MNMSCLINRVASLALLLAGIAMPPAIAEEQSPPNIVVILLDDAGFSDYSFLGFNICYTYINDVVEVEDLW